MSVFDVMSGRRSMSVWDIMNAAPCSLYILGRWEVPITLFMASTTVLGLSGLATRFGIETFLIFWGRDCGE